MKRVVKAWVPVSDLLNSVWMWGVRETSAGSWCAFMEKPHGISWKQYQREYGWRIAKCQIVVDDGKPAKRKRKGGVK